MFGFKKERPPKEVLPYWEAIRKNSPANQLDLQDINNHYDPATGPPWMCLVHMIRRLSSKEDRHAARKNVLKHDFENQIRTWDVVSTSLLSNDLLKRNKHNATLGSLGYILSVPSQNILATNKADAWIDNHAGRENNSPTGKVINSFALVDHILRRNEGPEFIANHKEAKGGRVNAPKLNAFKSLKTPSELIAKTEEYNEVLVVGRPGVRMHEDMPATAQIEVSAILLIKKDISEHDYKKYVDLAKMMSAANNNAPILQ